MFPRVINWADVRLGALVLLAGAVSLLSLGLQVACWV